MSSRIVGTLGVALYLFFHFIGIVWIILVMIVFLPYANAFKIGYSEGIRGLESKSREEISVNARSNVAISGLAGNLKRHRNMNNTGREK